MMSNRAEIFLNITERCSENNHHSMPYWLKEINKMQVLQNTIHGYATGRNILILFIITQMLYAFMLMVTIPQVSEYAGDMVLFDLKPEGYSVDYAQGLLETLGEDGRDLYLTHQIPVDFLYPGFFAVTYMLLLSFIFKRVFSDDSWMQVLVFVPFLAGIFDYLENIGIIAMLTQYPDLPSAIVTLSSVFSVGKSTLTTLSFVLLFVAIGIWLYQNLKKRTPKNS
ncbi:hypothetical protein GF340_01195 [Candidatus Peregrinibacteria bacterium]|nr:hypothetical protein [Candidatus Peregrinibacteria bacterium]